MRRIGPAPIRPPSSNTDRNTAKFNEIRATSPESANSDTIVSITPFGAAGLRRIRSSDAPVRPHGTSDSMPSAAPSVPTASTSRQSPSVESPSRPSAMENPRSVSVSRHSSAWATIVRISSAGMSRWRRIRTVTPCLWTRLTAWRTGFISGPLSENPLHAMIASSPSCSTVSPARS